MKLFKTTLSLFTGVAILALFLGLIRHSPNWPPPVLAAACDQHQCSRDNQSEDDYLSCNRQKQSCLEGKIKEAQAAQSSLANLISILNGQISVQELQVEQTKAEISRLEKQIADLSDRIAGLNVSLDKLSEVLVKRVTEHYKRLTTNTNTLMALLTRGSIGNILTEHKYLELAQQQTAEAMQRAEDQRLNYDQQKQLKEEAQTELEAKRQKLQAQQNQLTQQKKDQEYLLVETKHNESQYQQELAKTLAELEAIQSIIAGRGNESKVGGIGEGEQIASIIAGASACSTGSHLHFEVVKDGTHRDPAGHLKSIDARWYNDPDAPFSFSGSWNWPVENPAQINQGYGMTYYARVKRAYGGAPHTGIDIFSKDKGNYKVVAVKSGTLYRGSIKCGGGLLRYVRVEHDGDGLSTYYLHVNYI